MSQTPPGQLSQPHSHVWYKLAIVVLLVAVVGLSGVLALTTLSSTIFRTSSVPSGFTLVHGNVKGASTLGGPAGTKTIQFHPTVTDTLSAIISSNGNFQIALHSNTLYTVSLYTDNSFICTANPNTIIPSGSDYTQDFNC